jgi:hypothetical protein
MLHRSGRRSKTLSTAIPAVTSGMYVHCVNAQTRIALTGRRIGKIVGEIFAAVVDCDAGRSTIWWRSDFDVP